MRINVCKSSKTNFTYTVFCNWKNICINVVITTFIPIQFQFSFCYSLSHNTTYARLSPKKLIICNIFLHNQRMYSKITLGDMFSKKKNIVRTYLDKDVLSKIRWKSVKQNTIFLPFIIEALFTIYINIKWWWISAMNMYYEYVLWMKYKMWSKSYYFFRNVFTYTVFVLKACYKYLAA